MKSTIAILCFFSLANNVLAGGNSTPDKIGKDGKKTMLEVQSSDSNKIITTDDLERRFGSSSEDEDKNSSEKNPMGYLASHEEDIIVNWLNKTVFTKPGVDRQQIKCGQVQTVVMRDQYSDKAHVSCSYRASGYYAPGQCCKSVSGDVSIYYYAPGRIKVDGRIY